MRGVFVFMASSFPACDSSRGYSTWDQQTSTRQTDNASDRMCIGQVIGGEHDRRDRLAAWLELLYLGIIRKHFARFDAIDPAMQVQSPLGKCLGHGGMRAQVF